MNSFKRPAPLLLAALSLAITGCDEPSTADEKPTRPSAQVTLGTPSPAVPGCDVVDSLTGHCAWILTPPDSTGDGVPDPVYIPGTNPRFSLRSGDMPINTDIPFLIPAAAAAANPGTPFDGTARVDYSPSQENAVLTALNDLDGYSPTAYFDIPFGNGSLNAASVVPNGTVFLLPLETGTSDALYLTAVLQPPDGSPFDPALVTATQFSASVVTTDGNSTIRIKPTTPLLPKKKYLVVLTNDILNTSGAPITRSATFDLLASGATLPNPQLQPLRTLVNAWLDLGAGFLKFATSSPETALPFLRNKIALSYSFTTTDPLGPLVGMASPRAALFPKLSGSAGATTAISMITGAETAGVLPSPLPRTVSFPAPAAGNNFDIAAFSPTPGALSAGRATLYTGNITLPYFLTALEGAAPVSPTPASSIPAVSNFWRGNDTLGLSFPNGLELPVQPDSDGTYNVTYRFPFAKRTTDVTVPVQVTLPNPAHQPATFPINPLTAQTTRCGEYKVANGGYPVVIYLHGITSDRTSVIGLAHTLANNACVATVAIDLPMHGVAPSNPLWHYLNVEHADLSSVAAGNAGARERHFDLAQTETGQGVAMNYGSNTDGSGAWFINLAVLQNSRDNLRQAVVDLLNLNASLGSIDADGDASADFNTSQVSVAGVSLGGIVATTFVTVNQLARANDAQANAAISAATSGTVTNAFPIRLNPVKSLVMSVGGGQISRLLEASRTFGPRIIGGLHTNGIVPGSANYEKFMYVTQATVDSGDPVNFAPALRSLGVPVLAQEIVGGGNLGDGAYQPDTVVPNNQSAPVTHANYVYLNAGVPATATYTTDTSPFAGTDPLVSLLGLTTAVTTGPLDLSTTGSGAAARMAIGHHASLLTPNAGASPSLGNALATGEMQTQVASFIASPASTYFGAAGSGAAAPFVSVLKR